LRLSAVIDLYDLKLGDRRHYVKLFLESLMNAPKALWHPTLVVIDEAHKFCPEKSSGDAESTGAVIDLCSQGRKRGFGALLATQRLSKLHKDAAAELNNVAIGRTSLDVDSKRALDLLGMSANQKLELRNLEPGEFLMFGPACDWNDVKKFTSGTPKSTHPKAGKRHEVQPPQASTAIRKVLSEFADLPEVAAAEIRDVAAAKKRIAELERELKSGPKPQTVTKTETVVDQAAIDKAVAVRDRHWKSEVDKIQKAHGSLVSRLTKIEQLAHLNGDATVAVAQPQHLPVAMSQRIASQPPREKPTNTGDVSLGGGALRMIQVLADRAPAKFTESQWATLSKLKRTGGTWSTYKSRLLTAGYVEKQGDLWFATDSGVSEFGDASRAPQSADELRQQWKSNLGTGPARMIDALLGGPLDRIELAEACELTATAGTFSTYLSRLRSNGLINVSGSTIELSDLLQD
jgi:hypothetical protein